MLKKMQSLVNLVVDWAENSDLILGAAKAKTFSSYCVPFMDFLKSVPSLHIGDINLKFQESVKDLELVLDRFLRWRKHVIVNYRNPHIVTYRNYGNCTGTEILFPSLLEFY